MDEEELRKQQKKQNEDETNQKLAHTAGKGLSTYFGGQAGGKAYDAISKTKVGQSLEKAAGNAMKVTQSPISNKVAQKMNENGSLDKVGKLVDSGLSKDGLNSPVNKGSLNNNNGVSNTDNNGDSNTDSNNDNSNSSNSPMKNVLGAGFGGKKSEAQEESFVNNNPLDPLIKKYKFQLLGILGGFFGSAVVLVLVISIVYSVGDVISDFINGVVDFFTKDQQELEEEYYQTLKDIQSEINNKYGVCVDVNLITASLTVNTTFDEFLENSKDEVEDTVDNPDYNPDEEESESNNPNINYNYKQMTKNVRLLANMQIMRKKYSLDKEYKSQNGSYCSSTPGEKLVDSTNESSFNTDFFEWLNGESDLDSSTFEKIANHDKGGFGAFFTKKSNEEKNYAYYLYYPSFDSDGNCSDSYAKDMLPKDVSILSIGDSKTNEDSVYYWNLVNSFIPDYYDEYLPDDGVARTERIYEIADDIYSLYASMGPSQTCSVAYSGPSTLCPNGITIEGVGTFDFEEYVAGVVSREAYTSEGMEALKAQAVAARTYALNYTNYCEKVIPNNTNAQTFTQNINDRARQAVRETAGEILVDSDGKIFSSQYDSFCYDDEDCPDSVKNSDGTYTVTYTKEPNGEKHVITLSDPDQYRRITHGQGHAHGMSQLLSYQMAKEGKNYQEILAYFYSNGVEISLVVSPTLTDNATIIQKPITDYLASSGSSVDMMNQYIFGQVKKAGVSTREGVVAAAVSLVSGFYTETGYKLPYELKPSGKYSGYGMDPNWGTNTGNSTYPLNGLDCSGFISWAIHNGGYTHVIKNAYGWGQAGTSREWFKGTTDNNARPGDLIYNAPASENGTSGHIRMIVDVTSEGYVVAEASGRKNGVRINTISFTSTGKYYLVDMTNYYNSATKVTDYPQ